MRVGVSDAREDCVVVEEPPESAEVHLHREHEQQKGRRDREAAPRRADIAAAAAGEHARASGDDDEEPGDGAGDHRQRHQPAGDELPGGKSKQIEVQRPAEDRIDDAASRARRVPVERERRPRRHHAGAGGGGDGERHAERDQAQDRFDRQLHRLAVDDNCAAAGEVGEVRGLQREKRSVQNEKRHRGKRGEYRRLQVQRLPEHVGVPERTKPERVDVIGQRRSAAQGEDGEHGENDQAAATPPAGRRPGDCVGHQLQS